jgi:hypothetical protein
MCQRALTTCNLTQYLSQMPALALAFTWSIRLHSSQFRRGRHEGQRRPGVTLSTPTPAGSTNRHRTVTSTRRSIWASVSTESSLTRSPPERSARKGWSVLTAFEAFRRAAGILQDRNWLQSVGVPTNRLKGGRLTDFNSIHLQFLAGPCAEAEEEVPGALG